ncbi:major facilitator transporter [Anopheles sinensis]|uniref:Major facilitator transporter n=1 Tax=Anopheles sinensis TaxID=74873 RepID=A0A084VUW0_ANOSI|nr:major facilitator transporter [Anopheles sinensis]
MNEPKAPKPCENEATIRCLWFVPNTEPGHLLSLGQTRPDAGCPKRMSNRKLRGFVCIQMHFFVRELILPISY